MRFSCSRVMTVMFALLIFGVARISSSMQQNSAPPPVAQPDLQTVTIDFVPGERTIFFDDFSDMAPDEPPPHWKVRDGKMDLRTGGGIRELYTDGTSDVNLTSAPVVVPPNFTFQVFCMCQGRSIWKLQDKDGNDIFVISIEGTDDNQTVGAQVQGPDGTGLGDSGDVAHVSAKPDEFDLWAQQGRVRAYLNGKRFADANQITFAPVDHIRVDSMSYRPTGIRSVRLAEAAPDPATVLASTGKYVSHGIYFDTDSAVIQPQSAAVLKQIAAALQKNQSLKVEIDGYTDASGNAARNLELSQRRADAVRTVLITQFGIDAGRLTANGFGAEKPIAANETPAGRAQNRRVEFVRK
jgi:OOP family OmpA-OmpF porin